MWRFNLSLVCLWVFPQMLSAHEFWIEPQKYQVQNGSEIIANFKNGENFEGISLAYFDSRAARHEMQAGGTRRALTGRAGDTPAIHVPTPARDTLVVLAHETTPSKLTYKTWAKFQKFVAHKDFKGVEADHIARGWPQENFRESYTRHAKALIAVGTGAGQDTPLGLETEIVALTNPYAPNFTGHITVEVHYQLTPRADAQVEVFERAPDQSITISLHRTDPEGRARIPVQPGHDYLLDAVVIRPVPNADPEAREPVWETLWAALTFHVPE